MDEMYGLHPTTNFYADNLLMSPENYLMPAEYYQCFYSSGCDYYRTPVFGSDELISAASAISEAASITPGVGRSDEDRDDISGVIKAKIASHPFYPRLLEAYIDCQKVGAPPEIASLLDQIRGGNYVCNRDSVSTCLGADPELDDFMETFCDILVKYKSDLSRPFDEATTFLNKIETQLRNLCKVH